MPEAMFPAPSFDVSMPARYRQLFRGPVVGEHAAIVARCGAAAAHAEIWRRTHQGVAIACMVAHDHPWLLSFVCTALDAHAISMTAAHVYSRASPRGSDLVCLLWLQREDSRERPVVDSDVSRIAELVGGLLTGELTLEVVRPEARHRMPPDSATLTRFEPTGDAATTLLVVETREQPGILRAITDALLAANVRILKSIVATAPEGHVVHRFILRDQDGSMPDSYRRNRLQADVQRAINATAPAAPHGLLHKPSGRLEQGARVRTVSGVIPAVSSKQSKTG